MIHALAITVKLKPLPLLFVIILLIPIATGCSFFPETRQRDRIHNPFPQLKRVAVLPFFNQSNEPTLDTEVVTARYYAALQSVPGFEVMPIGVAKNLWVQYVLTHGEPRSGEDFQKLAKQLGVEALVVGSVTDFDSYYPPRLAMTVDWYAANEGFHPIPAGYGLPWGTETEKHIPKRIVDDAEFELARHQLATQTPQALPADSQLGAPPIEASSTETDFSVNQTVAIEGEDVTLLPPPNEAYSNVEPQFHDGQWIGDQLEPMMPAQWPNPTDLIPDPPSPYPATAVVNREPVLSHTRIYRGDDPYFTNRLADHVETGDDARPGGWQGYLRRSDDFIHFCCHLHITEMLESRGGSDQSDLILRWPLSRY